jgi:hypothetical protein
MQKESPCRSSSSLRVFRRQGAAKHKPRSAARKGARCARLVLEAVGEQRLCLIKTAGTEDGESISIPSKRSRWAWLPPIRRMVGDRDLGPQPSEALRVSTSGDP